MPPARALSRAALVDETTAEWTTRSSTLGRQPLLRSTACTATTAPAHSHRSDWCATIGSLAGISPSLALWFDRPLHAQSFGHDHHPHVIQIGDLRMPRLDPSQAMLDLISIFQSARRHSPLQPP